MTQSKMITRGSSQVNETKSFLLLPRLLDLSVIRNVVVRPIISVFHLFIMLPHILGQIVSNIAFCVGHGRLVTISKSRSRFVGGNRVVDPGILYRFPSLLRGALGAVGLRHVSSLAREVQTGTEVGDGGLSAQARLEPE